jgi:hypothetical protein
VSVRFSAIKKLGNFDYLIEGAIYAFII